MRNFLMGLTGFLFCFSLFAGIAEELDTKNLDLKVLTIQRYTSDFVSDNSGFQFDLSGLRIQKTFSDNVSAVLFPFFGSNSFFNENTGIKNNFLTWGVYEAYIKVEDIGAGISLWRLGLGETPWYKIEKTYYAYRYVAKPLAYVSSPVNIEDTGIYFNRTFLDKTISLFLGYHSGEGHGGTKDIDNAGALVLTATFFPMLNSDRSLKDLSLNIRYNANTKETNSTYNYYNAKTNDTLKNSFNVLLGYKYYKTLSASIEYFGTHGSTSADKTKAMSAFINYTFFDPYSILFRYDYTDKNGLEENYFLSGISTKVFKDALGVALTYALTDPCGAPASAKVLALNTVYYF